MKKYDIVKQAKIINIAVAALVCVSGVLLFALPFADIGAKLILGVLCIIIGIAKTLGYFSNDLYRLAFQFDFAFGLFVAVMGILILAAPDNIFTYLPEFVGILVLLDGFLKLQIALDARQFGMSKWLVILLTAVFTCLIGIATLVSTVTIITQYIDPLLVCGIALIVNGLENVWVTSYTVRVRSRKKNFEEKFGITQNGGNK